MADNIGRLSLHIGANYQQLTSALDNAARRVQRFIGSFASMSFLTQGPLGAFMRIGQQLNGILDEWMQHQMQVVRTSEALGITRDQYAGLARAAQKAGMDSDQFTHVLQHGLHTLAEANAGSREAQKAFEDLGLSWRELKTQNPADAFTQTIEAISRLQNPVDRVRAAVQQFGRAGYQLGPLLSGGAEGIRRATEEAQRMGLVASDDKLSKIREAMRAVKEVKEQVTQILGSLAMAIAPIMKGISNAFTEAFQFVKPIIEGIAEVVSTAFSQLAKWLSEVAGSARNLMPSFDQLKIKTIESIKEIVGALAQFADQCKVVAGYILRDFIAPILRGFAAITDRAGTTGNIMRVLFPVLNISDAILGSSRETAEAARNAADELGRAGDALVHTDVGAARRSTNEFFDGILRRVREVNNTPVAPQIDRDLLNDIRKFDEDLRKQIRDFGLSSDAIKRNELVLRGATNEQLRHVDALVRRREEQERQVKLIQEGTNLMKEVMTPVEKFEDAMTHLNDLFEQGIISMDTYARQAQKAMGEVAAAVKQDIKLPSLATQGSTADYQARAQARANAEGGDVQQRIQAIMQQQRELQRQQLQVAQQTLGAIQNIRREEAEL